MNVDYSAFEGWEIEGRPSDVTVRGKVQVRDGKFVGKLGHGKFLKRAADAFLTSTSTADLAFRLWFIPALAAQAGVRTIVFRTPRQTDLPDDSEPANDVVPREFKQLGVFYDLITRSAVVARDLL